MKILFASFDSFHVQGTVIFEKTLKKTRINENKKTNKKQ